MEIAGSFQFIPRDRKLLMKLVKLFNVYLWFSHWPRAGLPQAIGCEEKTTTYSAPIGLGLEDVRVL